MMKEVLVQVNDLFWIRDFVTKKVYADDQLVGSFKKDSMKLNLKGETNRLKIDVLGGLFSSECVLPDGNKPIVVTASNKSYGKLQVVTAILCLFVVMEILFFRLIPTGILFYVFWGILLLELVYIFARRRKRYSFRIEALG